MGGGDEKMGCRQRMEVRRRQKGQRGKREEVELGVIVFRWLYGGDSDRKQKNRSNRDK